MVSVINYVCWPSEEVRLAAASLLWYALRGCCRLGEVDTGEYDDDAAAGLRLPEGDGGNDADVDA